MCFILWAVTACGGSSDSLREGVADTEQPTETGGDQEPPGSFGVVSRSPDADATDRALATAISITFTDPLITETVSPETFSLTQNGNAIAAELDYEAGSEVVTLTPDAPLQPQTVYTVAVSENVMAEDGSQFDGAAWQFTTAGNVGPTPQSVMDQCMSSRDIEMLAYLNDTRARSRTCGDRVMPAVAPLAWNCTIVEAAAGHSRDMASNNFFSHIGSDGLTFGERLTNAGYQWRAAAENIAAGQTSVQEVMQAWLASPGHCVNIMGGDYAEVGAALVENEDADYRIYWTQDFAHPR